MYSDRGFKKYQRVSYHIDGEICTTGQYDITTRLNTIIAAFSQNNKDIGLYHDNGTPSTHFMSTTQNNLTGNQVIHKDFPVTEQGEYVSGRKFRLTVSALLYDPEQEIIHHEDTMTRHSNGGPQWRWRFNKFWGWYPVMVSPSTIQTIRHYGHRVGMSTWPLPPSPLYSPPFEQNHERVVVHHSPTRHPFGYTEYKTTWSYTYRLPLFDDISRPYIG